MWSKVVLALSAIAPVLALPNDFSTASDGITRSAFQPEQRGDYEFIVVGSGAGGGTLAARLAMAGRRTLLIEAGDDQGANLNQQIPAFHAYSTEDRSMAWDFYVNHFPNEADAVLDPKMTYQTPSGELYVGLTPPPGSVRKGILYPRAGTLGGCTAHNALVTIYPHINDWEHIQNMTGDPAWDHNNMRRLYTKIEDVDYLTLGLVGHGYNGWLGVGQASPTLATNDAKILSLAVASAASMGSGNLMNETVSSATNLARILAGDANSGSSTRDQTQGVFQIPLAYKNYRRNGSREFVIRVHQSGRYPLDIMYNTLVTRVTFEQGAGVPKASGVEFLRGKSLYRADPRASMTADGGTPGSIRATHEVILAGGTFNTPQMLKLSGIGPAEELRQHNIPVLVNLPGVGANLQDHMEIGVTHEARDAFNVVADCTYNKQQPDPCIDQWRRGQGPYATSNGFIYSVIKKSSVAVGDTVYGDDPDLLMFGGIANFKGYYPRYSDDVYGQRNWTWVILKAHTGNTGSRAGTVKLRSANPRDTPVINFNFFDAGNTDNGADTRDLRAMYEGVELARQITNSAIVPHLSLGPEFTEKMPGVQRRTEQQLMTHIRNEAWSHHASCTAKIGANNDPMAVLDSRLKVRGTQGLRVADASVFPRIPGFFVAVPTYMIGEQAAEMILGRRT